MNENQITLVSDTGEEELATILFTHEENGHNYVVFEFVESGDVSAATYVEGENGEGILNDIETDEEWEMLDELVEQYFEQLDDDIFSEEDEEIDEAN